MTAAETLILVVIVLAGFFLKGVTGLGAPLLIIPILAGFTGLEFAVSVIAIPSFIANVLLLWQTRSAAGRVALYLWPLLAAGMVGTVAGRGSWCVSTRGG